METAMSDVLVDRLDVLDCLSTQWS